MASYNLRKLNNNNNPWGLWVKLTSKKNENN